MNDHSHFVLERRDDGVCAICLNRPEVHNAFDDRLIRDLTNCLEELNADDCVRAVILTGQGRSFSAGADLNWMRRSSDYSDDENLADARALAKLMVTLNGLSMPTIAKVNGAAFGGGVGLICCCDIAIADDRAKFSTTEVRLGIMPSVISPYVIAAIGARQARRIMLTGERFDANEALRIGLVHQIEPASRLNQAAEAALEHILAGGPKALQATKALISDVSDRSSTADLTEETAKRIAQLRATPEAKEGLAAFFEKRSPSWCR